MKIAGILLALGLSLGGATLAGAAPDCSAVERDVDAQAAQLSMTADQLGALRALGDAARAGLKTCPFSEPLLYRAARTAEVLDAMGEGAQAGAVARDALDHAPGSARIATVLARIEGTEQAARHAYDLDPHYTPAALALALVLARAGKVAEALALANLGGGGAMADLARARVQLAAGRPRDAVVLARRALNPAQSGSEELAPSALIARDGNEVLGLALLADGKTREALGPLRAASSLGSTAAAAELRKTE